MVFGKCVRVSFGPRSKDTMDNFSIDQGTVIYGIRSSKYPTVPCYGVIITARCDIAQKKVPKYYFLIAVDASEWFYTEHGYEIVYRTTIQNLRRSIDSLASEIDLNGDVLISLSSSNLETILSNKRLEYSGDKKSLKKVDSLSSQIAEYRIFNGNSMTDCQRGKAIKRKPKPSVEELTKIDKGDKNHYYYLPQHAYLVNSIYNKGLIVDLLEIGKLSLKDAEMIKTPGIDYQVLPKLPTPEDMIEVINTGIQQEIDRMFCSIHENRRLSTNYWLNDDSDYVAIEGVIQSPWCEHLMQRFSNAFIRIGIDNPTQKDYSDVIARCYTEVTK